MLKKISRIPLTIVAYMLLGLQSMLIGLWKINNKVLINRKER